jgi:trimeric autotransporter adhesin
MKKISVLLLLLAYLCTPDAGLLFAQNIGINTDNSSPHASAILDVSSNTKGILVPRMSSTQRIAITSPADGLLVFDTDTKSFWFYSNNAWNNMASGWSLTGNTASNASNFLGTIDNMPLIIKTNNQISGRIIPSDFGNVSLGYQALSINDAHSNAAIGVFAARFGTGSANTAIGSYSLMAMTTGSNNAAIGTGALANNTSGRFNTGVGSLAEVSTGDLFNATAIGAGSFVNASNKVRIGSSGVTVIEGQVPFTTPSDGRFKFKIADDVKGLDFILQLRPVTYQFDVERFDAALRGKMTGIANARTDSIVQVSYSKASAIRRTGFIAQEVEQAALKAGYNFSGLIQPQTENDHYSLSYESFVVPLVKAVQEQEQVIDALKKEVKALAAINITLINRIEALESPQRISK